MEFIPKIILAYLGLLAVTAIPSYFLQLHTNWITDSSFCMAANAILILYLGYVLFTAAFFGIVWQKPDAPILASVYGIITAFGALINVWWFGPSIFDRITTVTQHCEGSIINGECNGSILSGFDPSGHVYFVVVHSVVLMSLLQLDSVLQKTYISVHVLLSAWLIEYTITCLFFHTLLERIAGFAVALTVLAATYLAYSLRSKKPTLVSAA